MGLQPRPGGNANVQMVREFHATPAICMRHAAPLGSLRAAQPQRGERDANAEEATGEEQLLRLERPLCKALYVATTYNALSKARPSLTNQENEEVMRFPHALHRPYTGHSPTPPNCPLSL